ncbi:bifunctional UDP-N-acetylglucosamine diphosphorylase/glucosamine-1-phosphate N-acetyltransferase GlmU [Inquilinus sp. CAU 1745]|uniref:bifunctional UDP-N-acetylglucosamine diphosphorylase/glucosamine-1-phosphate N-acetyltransferase GlmU n=1 Tax=Inquilinus sp. CAU 1745 TaxID=3140369 RepID=UPI00325A6117
MTKRPLACLVLAAGKGTRMKSDLPKVLHPVAGRPMVAHVVAALEALRPERIGIVVGPGMEDVARAVAPHRPVVQESQLGTGDAVRSALPLIEGFEGDVLVVFGDTPLVSPGTLGELAAALHGPGDPAVAVLGMRPDDPGQYGRLVLGGDGTLDAIVEYWEADEVQKSITLCNGGLMAFDGRRLPELLAALTDDNAKGEFYLTDAVAHARLRDWTCAVVEGDPHEIMGVNSRVDLAAVEGIFQRRFRARAMAEGVTLQDPDSVWFSADTKLGRDVTIGPSVLFGPGAVVEDGVAIRGFCHIEGATIRSGAIVGPFARLRPGADIGAEAHIGNFVEVKNATLGAGAKANHLAYLGDADVGAGANIGAGTITCNYDGFFKHRTVIGEGAFIGSNTALVAPVTVGDRATIGAGSVIAADVAEDSLAIERAERTDKPGWSARFRATKAAEKAAEKAASKKTPDPKG